MDSGLEEGVANFLKRYDLKKLSSQYMFQAPLTRKEMFKLYQQGLHKDNGAVGKGIIAETLKWAFFNDRRYLAIFLKNLDKNSDTNVRAIARSGFQLALAGEIAGAIQKISELKGIGGVTAGKILMFAYPKLFGMYDQFNGKAIFSLKVNGRPYFKKSNPNSLTPKQYSEEFEKYTHILRLIGKRLKLTPAEVDMGLFRLGRGY